MFNSSEFKRLIVNILKSTTRKVYVFLPRVAVSVIAQELCLKKGTETGTAIAGYMLVTGCIRSSGNDHAVDKNAENSKRKNEPYKATTMRAIVIELSDS